MIAVIPISPAEGDKKVTFAHDYMGRRVKKTVFVYASSKWQIFEERLFDYDGWNMVEEIVDDGATQKNRYFVWGLDLSGSLQGAGGIGGLLAMVDNGNTYHYFYDANGNVSQLVNAANGQILAHYEFDPFGNTVYQSGSMANTDPFRHATQYLDTETGLIAYKLRYYSSELGRWINRNPIGKEGGFNLYSFVKNNCVTMIDLNGLATLKPGEVRIEIKRLIIGVHSTLGSFIAESAGFSA